MLKLFSAVILPLAFLLMSCDTSPQDTPQANTQPTETAGTAESRVTLSDYEAIQNGMSLAEVENLLGAGRELSTVDIEGIETTRVVEWANPDGTNMNVTFQGDLVIGKAQFGLE